MPIKDLHKKPFSEETITKLDVFEDYAREWLPVFVMSSKEICIYDFFAGTGYDLNGVPGSPIRILTQVYIQLKAIIAKKTIIHIHFNEYKKEKFDLLKTSCDTFVNSHQKLHSAVNSSLVKIYYENEDFPVAFSKHFPKIQTMPALVFLDQNGVKYLSAEYLQKLADTEKVDFLYFVSSSYYLRFGETKEFKNSIQFDLNALKNSDYKRCHLGLVNELNSLILNTSKVHLYPFTIKKKSNIYGIVFGASHPLAIEKFLRVAWKKNPTNGLANFDIDNDDIKNSQPDLFGYVELTKIQKFQRDIETKVLSEELRTNKDVYFYTLKAGHVPEHSRKVLQRLKKEGKIKYTERTPCITYDKVCKESTIIEYQISRD